MDEKAQNWKLKLELERALRQQLLAIGEDGPKNKRVKTAREWFTQVSKILEVCVQESKNGQFDITPPVEIFQILSVIAADLGVGIIPQPISDVASRGRPAKGQIERRHISYATAYLKAVTMGVITDSSPIKTVKKAYGVGRESAQKWRKLPIPENIEILLESPDILKKKMIESGLIYQRAGRGISSH